MIKAVYLSAYDLEYAELLGLDWRREANRIEIRLRCPVLSWAWKGKVRRAAKLLGLAGWARPPVRILTLTFSGVRSVVESLWSQGHTIVGQDPAMANWQKNCVLEIEEIDSSLGTAREPRFRLVVEGLTMEFRYDDCSIRDEPSEPAQ